MFLTSNEKGVMATKYHTCLLCDSLGMKGVDSVLKRVVGALDAPRTLLYLSVYDEHRASRFDAPQPPRSLWLAIVQWEQMTLQVIVLILRQWSVKLMCWSVGSLG